MKVRDINVGEKLIFRRKSKDFPYSTNIIEGGVVEVVRVEKDILSNSRFPTIGIRFMSGLQQSALLQDLHEISKKRVVMRL